MEPAYAMLRIAEYSNINCVLKHFTGRRILLKKQLCIALSAIFVVFLVLGVAINGQKGLHFNDAFWKIKKDGSYALGKDRISVTGDGEFEILLSGETITARQSALPDGGIRMDFSDGWALERTSEKDFFYDFGSFAWSADAVLILTDVEKQNFAFAPAAWEERTPVHDADSGEVVGESVLILSEEGDLLDAWDEWFVHPEYSAPERETIVLEDGARLPVSGNYLLKNENGEYLLESHAIGRVYINGNNMSRGDLSYLLLQIGKGASEARGEAMATSIFSFVLLYTLGAAMMIAPEKMAFLGSRWQYKNEPELSEAGISAMYISGGVMAILGIIMLFVGL